MLHRTLLVTAALFASLASACTHKCTPEKIVFTDGFEGRVAILYGMPGAPALPKEGDQYLIEIPADGIKLTSTPAEYGEIKNVYVRRSGDKLVPVEPFGLSTGGNWACKDIFNLYVGDKAKQAEMDAVLLKKLEPLCNKK